MDLTEGRVTLESLENPEAKDGSWPARLSPGDWNGWALPYFDRATAEAITRQLDTSPATHASIGDTGVEVISEEAEFPEEVFEPSIIEGDQWYPIGAWAWCWSRVA